MTAPDLIELQLRAVDHRLLPSAVTANDRDMTQPDHSPIPAPETAADPIHSTTDMGLRWRALIGPLGFSERLLWFGFVAPDRCMMKSLHQVAIGRRPSRKFVESLMSTLGVVIDALPTDTAVALL